MYISGRANIPNMGNKTNIFSFQDLDSADYSVVSKGLPFKYNKTFYKDVHVFYDTTKSKDKMPNIIIPNKYDEYKLIYEVSNLKLRSPSFLIT